MSGPPTRSGDLATRRALSRVQGRLILLLAAAVVLANWRQPYPDIAPLQHVPTIVAIVAAPLMLRRWPLSDGAVASIVVFFLLHTFAGRWTYSNVPYDAWSQALTGRTISETFGLTRNGFDRVVHWAFGMLAIRPAAEVLRRHAGVGWRASLWVALMFVGAVSALYEVFEWLLTIILAPGMADDYNGQQGDPWDAQKDMAVAMIGGGMAAWWQGRRR